MRKIAVCEPQCKGASHESFNSAYLLALCKTYPDVEFCYFAYSTQIESIKKIYADKNIIIENLKFDTIVFDDVICGSSKKNFKNTVKKIDIYLSDEVKKCIFFTSTHPYYLYILKDMEYYCCSIIHGGLEELNEQEAKRKDKNPLSIKRLIRHPRSTLINEFNWLKTTPRKQFLDKHYNHKFGYLEAFGFCPKDKFSFVFLSHHIIENLSKLMTIQENFYYVPLLEIPPERVKLQAHNFPKFAVYGYGAANNLFSELASLVSDELIDYQYEIRNIGMRVYPGCENNSKVVQLGRFLSKKEMEEQFEDIDFMLNFYTKDSYKFTMSGSVLETITYERPAIYISNDCYNSYNTPYKFGIECDTVKTMASEVIRIVKNWDTFGTEYSEYLLNVKKKKEEVSIEKNIPKLIAATSLWE